MRCENAIGKIRTSIGLNCSNNKARYILEISHNDSKPEMLFLCGLCTKTIQSDAKQHGYTTKINKNDGNIK